MTMVEELLDREPGYATRERSALWKNYCWPPEEPSVPSIYQECWHPTVRQGYSTKPMDTRVVRLCRKKYYTPGSARKAFAEMNLKQYGEMFWSPGWWCWEVTDA